MKRFFLFFIPVIACLTSCDVVQYVTVPVNYGPKTGFSLDTSTIVVVNKFNADTLSKVKDPRRVNVLKKMGVTALTTAANQLKFLPRVGIINLVDSVTYLPNDDSVKFLAKKYKANYVLVLNDVSAGVYTETSYNQGMAYTYYATKVKTRFALYESNGIYSKKLNGMAEVPQDEAYNGGFSSLFYRPTYRSSIPALSRATADATLDAFKDYLPYSITNDRPLYGGGDMLESSVAHIKAGKFDLAFNILNPLIDGPDKKLASKAAYNLAVVYEAQGDIEEALKTAKISNDKNRNDFANALIVDLMKE
ncbi:tetratricopeptide repeat protein [Mucilaginibacter dorajii]|uniref:Tetratricopeptide repeat protein n=1 Tax=Mucilaginibacter dorajii TaxID=692994 RepID=A0ABP7Q1G5_9SPHI|nr:tetratricopeptide repeat protein [Mucilaginibacter dorajii]MCS3732879.1 tetratricopeptide (TPR) repeat protein [Mucilaginibacter dorajii]